MESSRIRFNQTKNYFEIGVGKFSTIIDLEEIKENDYNLNVSRYIDILPEEELINLDECLNDVVTIFIDRKAHEQKFKENMDELGYEKFTERLDKL